MDRKQTHEMVVEMFGSDIDCEISYYYTPPDNGGSDGEGRQDHPASDEDFEIVEMRLIESEWTSDKKWKRTILCDIWKGIPDCFRKTLCEKLIESIKDDGY